MARRVVLAEVVAAAKVEVLGETGGGRGCLAAFASAVVKSETTRVWGATEDDLLGETVTAGVVDILLVRWGIMAAAELLLSGERVGTRG